MDPHFGSVPGVVDDQGRQYVTLRVTNGQPGDRPLRMIGSLNADDVGRYAQVWGLLDGPRGPDTDWTPRPHEGTIQSVTHHADYRTMVRLAGYGADIECRSRGVVRFTREGDPRALSIEEKLAQTARDSP